VSSLDDFTEPSTVCIPWRCWYGDERLALTFPPSWQFQTCWPTSAPDIGQEGIDGAFDKPIGTPTVEALARGKRWIAIAVDDISRPTPASRVMPVLMQRLEQAGADLGRVRVVLAIGTHRPMVKADIVKKIGQVAADRLAVYNSHPYDNVQDFGTSARGTPVHICRFFAEADLKIGVGSIMPHGAPGFSGGAKVIIPGVAGIETITAIHQPGRLRTAFLDVGQSEFRADIEQMVGEKVGLDCVIDAVPNSQRGIAGLFVGDMIHAHRAGVQFAQQAYATEMPTEPVDIAVCNAYPKDTDAHQKAHGLHVLRSSPRSVVKEDGTIVVVSASPEGYGYHGIYGPGMRYDLARLREKRQGAPPWTGGASVVNFVPGLSAADARKDATFRRWGDVVKHLMERYGDKATVAVFPCGSMQLARESVGG
jgi:nickel-dependent lactate racemase